MDLSNLGKYISQYAPILGSVISNGNPVTGLLINAISHIFGADSKDYEDIFNKISVDKDAQIKLKKLELDHEEILQKNIIEDSINARYREVSIVKETGHRDFVMDIIAIAVVIGYFACCCIIPFVDLPKADHDILYMMLGQLTGGFIMVLSHYFGSARNK